MLGYREPVVESEDGGVVFGAIIWLLWAVLAFYRGG